MKIRLAGWSILSVSAAPAGEESRRRHATSPAWRCARCGAERHFPGPVQAAAALPCPACGANTLSDPVQAMQAGARP